MQLRFCLRFLPIIFVAAAICGCRSKPTLDLGYEPQFIQNTERDKQAQTRKPDRIEKIPQTSYDIVEPLPVDLSWQSFAGGPPEAATTTYETVPDRRWGPIYFAYNQSFIGETERRKLEKLADYLLANKKYHLVIEGHCDERGSEEYNRSLGEKRALSVRDYLVNLGVGFERIQTISYGEEQPVATGRSEDAYAKNRRAEFIITLPHN